MLASLLVAAAIAVDEGPLHLDVLVSPTAQLFHVVDQLSNWTPYAHAQYRRALSLDAADEALLAEHAKLRQKTGYGVLDRAFLADVTLDAALASLDAPTADVERRVLTRFQARVEALAKAQDTSVRAFSKAIDDGRPVLRAFAEKASRFWGGSVVRTTIVLVASPSGGGGGYNGGRLVVEVGGDEAPLDVLQHELWHAFAEPHQDALLAVAEATDTDYETVSEGLAYAVMPGIIRAADGTDQLAKKASRDLREHKAFFDEPYVRFWRLGVALRPALERAFREGTSFEQFLPVERAIVDGVVQLAMLEDLPDKPRLFWFGIPAKELAQKFATTRNASVWSRPLEARFLAELRPKMRPGDLVVLVPPAGATIPAEFSRLGARGEAVTTIRADDPLAAAARALGL